MKRIAIGRTLLCGVIACTALSVTRPARADYSNTVMSFNPVMYYRLNETTPVPSDWATNLGSFGTAGQGLYLGDANLGEVTHAVAGIPGAGTDTAIYLPNTNGGWGGYARVRIPYRPELNANAPFSVEFWAQPAITTNIACPASSVDFSLNPRRGWMFYQGNAALGNGHGWYFRVCRPDAAKNIAVDMTLDTTKWYHVVGVYDGTNIKLYTNGTLANSAALGGSYAPVSNANIPITFGGRADGNSGNYGWGGNLDEAAYYGVALSDAQVLAHYQAGINSAPPTPYHQVVLADTPLGYWRLNEPVYSAPDPNTLPVAKNLGAFGAAADGAFGSGLTAGTEGVPYTGFEANNYAPYFNSQLGSVSIPGQAVTTDTLTLTCWIKREGNQSLGGLVFQRDASMASATGLQIWDSGGNNELRGNWNDGDWSISTGLTPPSGVWTFAAMVVTPTDTVIYMNDQSVSLAAKSGAALTHAAHDFSIGSLLIGQDPCCGTRIFNGKIDEVAVFGTALTPAQISQLFTAGKVPPVILTQPQASTTVNVGAPVTLNVVASGNPTLKYQWTKNGTNLTGKTTSTLAFPSTALTDSGDYAVVVTNDFGAVTSSIASVSITPVPAAFLRAVGYPVYNSTTQAGSLTQVILEFSAPLDPSAIASPANYVITDGATPLTVTGAAFTNLNQTVLLTTAPQSQGRLYTVTLNNIVDATGLTISSPTNTAQFTSWVASPAGGVLCEVYYGGSGNTVAAFTNNPAYPNDPAFATNLYIFDSRIIYPNNDVDTYGMRMSTVFTPPTSGKWRFYIRSDDDSELYFNPSGPSRSGRTLILSAPSCCYDWSAYQSSAFSLVAGQSYYLELLYKEGSGGDFGKVAARLDGEAAPSTPDDDLLLDPASLNGPAIGYLYSPADVGGPLTVVGPTNLTVKANHAATFFVSAAGPEDQAIFYQWKRNGTAIEGATGTSYTLYPTTADSGAQFSVQVSKLGSVVTLAATLTVTADNDKPVVAAVRGTTALNTVLVRFSELVDLASAQNPANYSIPGHSVSSAYIDAAGTTVTLTISPDLAPGQVTTVNVSGVLDRGGNEMTAATPTLRAFVLSRGLLQYDYFGQMPLKPEDLGTVYNDPRFPAAPDWTTFITSFDSRMVFPDNSHDAYASRVSGVLVPPTSGDYMLYLKSDDQSELNFNAAGTDPIAKVQVQTAACCPGFADHAAGPYTLAAGQLYFIETVQKEGGGGDYVQVAAKLASDSTDPNRLLPAPANMVGVLADPEGASVSITQEPASYVGVYRGSTPSQTLFAPNFATGNGGLSVVAYATPVGPWSYNATSGSWTNCGGDGPAASGLNTPPIIVPSGGGLTLTFSHRYSFEGFNANDTTAWDGGQVRMSVNGGPFITVPSSAFSANGYVNPIEGSILGALQITPGWTNIAFVGESAGYTSGTKLTSVASLGQFNAGDTVVIQFLSSWDDASQGTAPNWEISSVQVAVGASSPATFNTWLAAAATSIYQNEPNAAVSYIWQKDTGAGFVELPGTGVPICPATVSLTDNVVRYRCIASGPGASATSAVATVTVTLPVSIAQTAPSTLTVRWPLPTPLAVTSFVLEKSQTLAAGSWTTVPTSTYQTDATSVFVPVTVSPADPPVFYRLRRQ